MGAALTGDDYDISRVTQTIACSDACHPLARTVSLDYQMLKFTLRPSQNEFDSSLFAQMPGIYTGLSQKSQHMSTR